MEIHQCGKVGDSPAPTFKWSRDNGSVATAWLGTAGNDLAVASSRGFAAGNWVELVNDNDEYLGNPGVLVKLANVAAGTLSVDAGSTLPDWHGPLHPKVRRWDQTANDATQLTDGAVPIKEAVWLTLEDGIQIQFDSGRTYRTGDYWLAAARVVSPSALEGLETFEPPHGPRHYYAPLGFVSRGQAAGSTTLQLQFLPCRCVFYPLNSCAGNYSMTNAGQFRDLQPLPTVTPPPGTPVAPPPSPPVAPPAGPPVVRPPGAEAAPASGIAAAPAPAAATTTVPAPNQPQG